MLRIDSRAINLVEVTTSAAKLLPLTTDGDSEVGETSVPEESTLMTDLNIESSDEGCGDNGLFSNDLSVP